ncbi:MAG: TolC family protein, partial [Bacteroidaceae bacterium]|nr:TolC family protein [Bacteroidaceae bacterium]
ATEDVSRSAIRHYFNWLLANEDVEIYRQNLDNARRLYDVAKAKREMGQISENDVLQLRLNMLQAESALTEGISTMRSQDFALKNFLDLPEDEALQLVVPDSITDIIMNYQDVLDKAQQNNAFAQRMALAQLEADYSVAVAKGNLRQINLYASVGLTGTNHDIGDAYSHTRSNQVVEVGISIPLVDWGKRHGRVRVAESNRKVTESRLREQRSEFRQNIFILTEQFNNQLRQLHIAEEADRIAQRRYHTNVETFMIGRISTLDLNDAQSSKDQARIKYISELYSYWNCYYQLRSLTLWDFEKNTDINADFENLIEK